MTFSTLNFYIYNNYTESIFELFFALASIYGYLKLKSDHNINFSSIFATLLIFLTTLTVIFLFKYQDGIIMWGLLFPIVAINLGGTKQGLTITILFNLLVYIGGYYYSSIEAISHLTYTRFVAISIIISLLVYFYEKSFSWSFQAQNQLNNILQKNAITDSLTNLFNRRQFDDVINEEFNRAKRAKKSFIIAIIDVDNFKAYNDTYGHSEGDNILIKLGEILNLQTSRSGDYAFRIGGEEFAIILQSKSYEDIYTHFEHLRLLIESEEILHTSNKPYNYLTVSIGVALAQDSNKTTLKDIYSTADKNLYYIKQNGRNGTKLTTLCSR